MANSSHGPRLAAPSAGTRKPLPMPRLVRVGRPANDNYRPRRALRLVVTMLAAATIAVLAGAYWSLI